MASLFMIFSFLYLIYKKEKSEATEGDSFVYPEVTPDPLKDKTLHVLSFDRVKRRNTITLAIMTATVDRIPTYNEFVIPRKLDGQVFRSILTGKYTAHVYTGDYILFFIKVERQWILSDKHDCKKHNFKTYSDIAHFIFPGAF